MEAFAPQECEVKELSLQKIRYIFPYMEPKQVWLPVKGMPEGHGTIGDTVIHGTMRATVSHGTIGGTVSQARHHQYHSTDWPSQSHWE